MISIQVIAQIGLSDANAGPNALRERYYEFDAVPRVGETITVWWDDEPERLRVVSVEYLAAREVPDTDEMIGGLTSPITRVTAQWLNE